MFVQVIRGHVGDREELTKQLDLWTQNLMPQAEGFLGSTGGITDDGVFITLARFESEEAARRNSDRPEQGEWWSETEKHFDGPVTFHDCREVDFFLDGGSDDAGFVQILEGRATDRDRLREIWTTGAPRLSDHRPDIIGGIVGWHTDSDGFTEAVYFTSEAAAREGESTPRPPDIQTWFENWQQFVSDLGFYDLRQPILVSK